MKILELQEYAKKNGFDSIEFKFTNHNGDEILCKWLDAYFGFFKLGSNEGFVTVGQWVELTGDIFDFKIIEQK